MREPGQDGNVAAPNVTWARRALSNVAPTLSANESPEEPLEVGVMMGGWAALFAICALLSAASFVLSSRGLNLQFAAVVFALIAALSGVVAFRDHSAQQRLAGAGSAVGGAPISVQCPDPFIGEFLWTPGEGHVQFDAFGNPDGVARLDGWVCNELAGWPGNAREDRARVAVHILTHEVGHLRGELDEAATECWAAQHSSLIGEALGADPTVAAEAQRWYITTQLPRMRGDYRDDTRCRSGGEWDAGRGAFADP